MNKESNSGVGSGDISVLGIEEAVEKMKSYFSNELNSCIEEVKGIYRDLSAKHILSSANLNTIIEGLNAQTAQFNNNMQSLSTRLQNAMSQSAVTATANIKQTENLLDNRG